MVCFLAILVTVNSTLNSNLLTFKIPFTLLCSFKSHSYRTEQKYFRRRKVFFKKNVSCIGTQQKLCWRHRVVNKCKKQSCICWKKYYFRFYADTTLYILSVLSFSNKFSRMCGKTAYGQTLGIQILSNFLRFFKLKFRGSKKKF